MTPLLKPAQTFIPSTGYSDHSLSDARSLALHCKIAFKINKDRCQLDKARENLASWRRNYNSGRAPVP